MNRLHVLHVTKRYPGAVGGDATAVVGLEREQWRRGHRVTVVTSNCSAIADDPHVRKFGLSVSEVGLDRISLRRILSCLWGIIWGLRLLRRERPDIVHAHAPDLGAALALSARLLGIPHVLTLHGTCIGNPMFSGKKSWMESILVRVGDYDRLFTVDPQTLPVLGGLARIPPVFIANGIASEEFMMQGPQVGGTRLLFVGRLEAVKSVDVLLTAVAEARAEGCHALLDIVGSGGLEADLRQLAADLDLDDHVRFLGQCTHEEVKHRLAAATAFVLPSSYEGFPVVLLEAWASGVPIIATSVAAIPDICTDGVDALLVPPLDPSALARAIIALLNDPKLAAQLASAGRNKVKRYSHAAVSAELDKHYYAVLSARRRGFTLEENVRENPS